MVLKTSLDIDNDLLKRFVELEPERARQRGILERELRVAVTRHFENQLPVRHSLGSVQVFR